MLLGMHAFTYSERPESLGLERVEALFGHEALQADDIFLYFVSLHVLEANHPIQTVFTTMFNWCSCFFSPTASWKFGIGSQFTPILLASIHLSEHLWVLTLLITVTFKTRFYSKGNLAVCKLRCKCHWHWVNIYERSWSTSTAMI